MIRVKKTMTMLNVTLANIDECSNWPSTRKVITQFSAGRQARNLKLCSKQFVAVIIMTIYYRCHNETDCSLHRSCI